MELWRSLGGMVETEVTSADIPGLITALNGAGIPLYNVTYGEDPLTIRFQFRRSDGYKLRKFLDKRGEIPGRVRGMGIYWALVGLLRRPVLLIGMLMLLLMTVFLPTRVLFLKVEGNTAIPTKQLLQACEACGIGFGAARREVRSEKAKNALLSAIPQLQWAGVNTSGCVATITVRERSGEDKTEAATGVSSIVALRDGVITDCTVTKGSPSCKVGQAVRAGQVLISGYTDCGSTIRAERAEGEVFAETERSITALYPSDWLMKTAKNRETRKYALIIGKKRINLYKGSGILDTGCDKMYSENYLTLPGGFQLPIAIVTEVWQERITEDTVTDELTAGELLSSFAKDHLSAQMIAGQVRHAVEFVTYDSGVYCLTGKYACTEMIGTTRSEEILKPNGEHD